MKIFVLPTIFCLLLSCRNQRIDNYLFNDADSGWFIILYNIEGAQKIAIQDNKVEFNFTKSHVIETSSAPMLGSYNAKVSIIDNALKRRNLESHEYSIYPSRYVEKIFNGNRLYYQEFHFGKEDGSGDASILINEYLKNMNHK